MKKITFLLSVLPLKKQLKTILFIGLGNFAFGQDSAVLSGVVLDENNNPIEEAIIKWKDGYLSTDKDGKFKIILPSKENIKLEYSYSDKESLIATYQLKENENKNIVVYLATSPDIINLKEATISFQTNNKPFTSISLDAKQIQQGPNITGGITEILKTLPYVNSNTELSSQYMVRGGNYDENLIYINGIEIYKPQLIRNGEQEGLSIINPFMADLVNFSAGGWESKYGDKMSSVLDIYYKNPKKFEASIEASFMGGNLTLGGASKNKKLSAIIGVRYQNRNLILNTLDGDTNFNPTYQDVQANINYKLNNKWNITYLGTFTNSRFEMIPKNRTTYFGTLTNLLAVNIYFNGKEKDKYTSQSNNIGLNFNPNSKINLSFNAYNFHTKEKENFDILASYLVSEIDNEGNPIQTYDIGSQLNHARNNLDILVSGFQHRGKYLINSNKTIDWGLNYQNEDVKDLLNEWQYLELTGGKINNIDNFNNVVNAKNELNSNRFSAFAQYTSKFLLNESKVLFNIGVRSTYWSYNKETNISPRAQIAIKPNWDKDMVFRFATGFYYQPPFYRETRRLDGSLNNNVKAQQSIHFILGNDYEFTWMDRPFKLTSEVYYKILNHLNPYTIDNVRVRYTADNNSKGYAYGLDLRLFGQFVPGIDSWFSASYARAYQNIDKQGFIPLPTDPRLKFSLFFQDYMNFLPSFKVNVNLIYASGLPNGAPLNSNPYLFTSYLKDYKRVDLGIIKEFINQTDLKPSNNGIWKNFKEVSLGLDIFNLMNIKNNISNIWLTDVANSKIYAVPNNLTGRFFNLKIIAKL